MGKGFANTRPEDETVQEIRMHLYAPVPGREPSPAMQELEADQFAAFAAQMGVNL